MTSESAARLALDEMFSPAEIFAWSGAQDPWLLTENVKDFRPLQLRAAGGDTPAVGVLYSSSRSFPRSRKNPGPLITALHAWLRTGPPEAPITEDWLDPAR